LGYRPTERLSRGILETIVRNNDRVKVKTRLKIGLADQNTEVGPVPTSGDRKPEPELGQLSNIMR